VLSIAAGEQMNRSNRARINASSSRDQLPWHGEEINTSQNGQQRASEVRPAPLGLQSFAVDHDLREVQLVLPGRRPLPIKAAWIESTDAD
jgi:hypothetical protein